MGSPVFPVKSFPRPAANRLAVSSIVNSKYPSPETISCCEIAPASLHPSQPFVFCNEPPLAAARVTSIQIVDLGALGGGGGGAGGEGGVGGGGVDGGGVVGGGVAGSGLPEIMAA